MERLRKIVKKATHPFLKRGLHYYYRKPRRYRYQQIEVMVHPDVFPPQLTLSTKILLDFISEIDLTNKHFLELGCGSGIISLLAAKKGAKVMASDINETALSYLETAAKTNELKVSCIQSDLFTNIPPASLGSDWQEAFDYIVINPPYYPKKPANIREQAWFCGSDFEYFEALFKQLPDYLSEKNTTYMILSEDCETQTISRIAAKRNVRMESIFEIKKLGELNYIFQLHRNL